MKPDPFLHVCGSIMKKESLVPINSNILANTVVAEADKPYTNYYGGIPEKNPVPNSLFLFTKRYYSLEEILRYKEKMDSCTMKNINVASAMVNFSSAQVPAIRIKYFPDYSHLNQLQECFRKQNVEFATKFQPEKTALVQIHKCFVLEEVENRIFLDQTEKYKAYIALPFLLNYDEFLELISDFRNNSNCNLFDAALAGFIINSRFCDVVRIFAENMNIDLLRYIKSGISQVLRRRENAIL